MSVNPSSVSIKLSAPIVKAIVESLTEEQRIEITRGVMTNVVDAYLRNLSQVEANAIEEAVKAETKRVATEVVEAKFGKRSSFGSSSRWHVEFDNATLEAIRSRAYDATVATINKAVDTAAEARLATLPQRIEAAVIREINRHIGDLVESAVSGMTQQIRDALRLALK